MANMRAPGRFPSPGPPATTSAPPQLNGALAARANSAVVGPSRVLHGYQPQDVVVPGVATTRNFVLLASNDQDHPMAVRLRLARNGTEGRIALSPEQAGGVVIAGVFTPVSCEYIDLVNWDHSWEGMLFNGDRLWALGTWPGMVPLSVVVTVLRWSP